MANTRGKKQRGKAKLKAVKRQAKGHQISSHILVMNRLYVIKNVFIVHRGVR